MTQCSAICVKSRSFEFPRRENLAILIVGGEKPTACVVCEKRAHIVCAKCYCVAYCDKFCLLSDYERHEYECELHCPRLWTFRRFERLSTQAVRFKHTGDPNKGIGVFARRQFLPGDRVLEDCVQLTSATVNKAVENKNYAEFGHMTNFIRVIYGKHEDDGLSTFSRHSGQIMALTGGYQGSWSTFINHACFPNCVMMVSDCKEFMLVTAIRDIAQGEEIVISYAGISCAPLCVRASRLETLLGTPCICPSCLEKNKSEEHARSVIWDVIQHSRGGRSSELLTLNSRMKDVDVIEIADNVINIARTILGSTPHFSEPWLAIVECTVYGYTEEACALIKSAKLRAFSKRLRGESRDTARHVGVCSRLLVK